MFRDRQEAGTRLAEELTKYKNDEQALVLAIPRGGVIIGMVVSDHLNVPFDLIIVRKLPLPYNPEAGFGAIAEDGSIYMIDEAAYMLAEKDIRTIQTEQIDEIARRKKVLRRDRAFPDLKDKTVIIVDDGLAMGSTMRAAIRCCRRNKADKIVVAVPVSGEDVAAEIEGLVDELYVLEEPEHFRAVAQVYQEWRDLEDEEVLDILEQARYFLNK